MYAKYMDFLRFTSENTLIYTAVLKFLDIGDEKIVKIKNKGRRFEILAQLLEDRVA